MKNKYFVWAAMICGLLCSCNNDDNGMVEPTDDEMVTMSFNLAGEVSTTETPLMSRALDSANDLCGIQVYEKKANASSYFAYQRGLFDDFANVKINLHKDCTYKFECLIVKNGKNIFRTSGANYFFPNGSGYHYQVATAFTIGEFRSNLGVSHYRTTKSENDYYPLADSYYAELEGFEPSVNGTIEMDMKHVVFGLKYKVSGVTDGTVAVTIKNDKKTFVSNTSIAGESFESEEMLYTFYDRRSAWQYADNDYMEDVELSVSWTRGVGITQDLGKKTIKVKRNMMNVVSIQLKATNEGAGIGITTETEEMAEESKDVTLE